MTTADEDRIAARRSEVLRLRTRNRWSYRRIGEAVGVSHVTVKNDLDVIRDEMAQENRENGERLRAEELAMLDEAIRYVQSVIAGEVEGQDGADETKDRLAAVDKLVKLSERRAKLLGLDAPEKFEGKIDQSEITPAMVADRVRAKFGKVTPKPSDDVAEDAG